MTVVEIIVILPHETAHDLWDHWMLEATGGGRNSFINFILVTPPSFARAPAPTERQSSRKLPKFHL